MAKARIAVLVSGGGTNLQALIDAQSRGELGGGEIVAVISSKAGAYALERAKNAGDGIIVGGTNYGQGSSREHAALVPMYLGIRCVIAKSFARIHVANLINAGILPLTFRNPEDYDTLSQDAELTLSDIRHGMEQGSLTLYTQGKAIALCCDLIERQQKILLAGGLLNTTKEASQ